MHGLVRYGIRRSIRDWDATAYLETTFPEDAAAIRWLNEHVTGDPVVLEANGDSYSDYERVSAMTGLPTVLGWYVHEWLWRGDTGALNERAQEVEAIYTSTNQEDVKKLLEKYQVRYIFVGAREREKYAALNESMLQSHGKYCIFRRTKPDLCAAGCIFGAVGYNKKDTKYAVHPTGRTSG